MEYEVSGVDLQRLEIPYVTYDQLMNFNTIDALFDYYGSQPIALLFLTHPDSGHWTLLSPPAKEGGPVQFFDSYGLGPDMERGYLTK